MEFLELIGFLRFMELIGFLRFMEFSELMDFSDSWISQISLYLMTQRIS